MKKLFPINRILVIINVLLGFTIYLGLLFLIPLGIVQLIMSAIIIKNRKQLTHKTNTLFGLYCTVTSIILSVILLMYCDVIQTNETLIKIGVGTSIIMAFLHLHITYLINKETEL